MAFASAWLEKSAIFPPFINKGPNPGTGIIVVIPSFDEPGITKVLDSLALCDEPVCKTEVIVVVNAPGNADAESLENNRRSIASIKDWKECNNCFFSLHVIDVTSARVSGWGVGLARKTGMDEAVRRFNSIDMPGGVILNLDADCTVDRNYFTSVAAQLLSRKDRSACSIYFEHPVSGDDFSEDVYRSVIQYELHLRYYFQGLAYTGFPDVHHTVGSATAVKALAYVKAGGMNRRMAGEDFYFIQKLVPAGGYFNLNLTTVHPSPRSSFRVPFGTGAVISKMTGTRDETLMTYNFKAFRELKSLFGLVDMLPELTMHENGSLYSSLPQSVRLFISETEWNLKIDEIKNNTGSLVSFRKRFFSWFNMFRTVKYLNAVHESHFNKKPVAESASELLTEKCISPPGNDPLQLLHFYRQMERQA